MIFGRESFIQNLQVFKEKLSRIALIVVCRLFSANVSVNSKPDIPPGEPRGFEHSSCPQGSGFRSSVLPRALHGGLPGGLKSK